MISSDLDGLNKKVSKGLFAVFKIVLKMISKISENDSNGSKRPQRI